MTTTYIVTPDTINTVCDEDDLATLDARTGSRHATIRLVVDAIADAMSAEIGDCGADADVERRYTDTFERDSDDADPNMWDTVLIHDADILRDALGLNTAHSADACITAAIEYLNATETATGSGYRWHDDASNSTVEASADDLEQLGAALLNDGDVDQAMAAMCIETVPPALTAEEPPRLRGERQRHFLVFEGPGDREHGLRVLVTGWTVRDADGGTWFPNDDADAEIEASDDPAATAVTICRDEPMRGTWSS